ncbi:transporter substrate-binding domain-containing protein [Moorena sp. SIO4G3]|uniref:transporter substrate-binding domain-containing protein n=1 Tax=Moorena sp. SIO4G3 TaxID=2607821 RepID=UPI00142B71F6|nr:transporter substrate-binding domain-containing protein [Moorena sp. SIO4G3]NEO77042.1 transporter substrate-binding domain-containing protein [Moorena sp. SIO4G3]
MSRAVRLTKFFFPFVVSTAIIIPIGLGLANLWNPPGILEKIEKQDEFTIKIGLRADSSPISHRKGDKYEGYCTDFAELIRYQIEESLPNKTINIEFHETSLKTRFRKVAKNTIHLECGPNTIGNNHKGTQFSIPFMSTSVSILTKKGRRFDSNNETIGVLKSSSTKNSIKQHFTGLKTNQIQEYGSRAEAINALNHQEIDAFVSDKIILIGGLQILGFDPENYEFQELNPGNEKYGMIISSKETEWLFFINQLIKNKDPEYQCQL